MSLLIDMFDLEVGEAGVLFNDIHVVYCECFEGEFVVSSDFIYFDGDEYFVRV